MANFETIKLDKGLYHTSKGFLAELESIDPSENYKGTSLEGLDAFERQLKRFDIKVKGPNSDTIDKFFATTDSAALFPEYISRAVYQGVESSNTVDKIIATKTNINGLDYRSIVSTATDADKSLNVVQECTTISQTTIRTQDKLVTLKKHGRMLVASYEAIRFQKLDLFNITLRQIGAHIARSQFNTALNTLIKGDGNNNEMEIKNPIETGKFSYLDFLELWNNLAPYELNTLIVQKGVATSVLQIPEFKDAHAGLNFQGTGSMITPFGAKMLISDNPECHIVGLDKNYAIEMVTAGGIQTEFDKLIDRQLERAAISQITGFSKIFNDAAKGIKTV